MDKLKYFIEENRASFDEETLPEGHEARFLNKLQKQGKPKTKRIELWSAAIAVAAAITFLLLMNVPNNQKQPQEMLNSELLGSQKEIDNLKLYYHMKMYDVISEMQEMSESQSIPGKSSLLAESERIINDSRTFEEEVLPTLKGCNQTIHTMNNHYEKTISTLEFMRNEMKEMEKTQPQQK